jgi:hypothetical protein
MPANPSSAQPGRLAEPWRETLAARYIDVSAHSLALAAP